MKIDLLLMIVNNLLILIVDFKIHNQSFKPLNSKHPLINKYVKTVSKLFN
jgi:hypothetical protein